MLSLTLALSLGVILKLILKLKKGTTSWQELFTSQR